jgi:hypothetical protein
METVNEQTSMSSLTNDVVFKHAAKFGVILGAISGISMMLVYAVDYSLMVSLWFGLFMFALAIGFVIYAGINFRREAGGYLPYGKAFIHGYLTFLTSALIGTIFSLLLYTVIDPELPEKLADVAVENMEAMMLKFGAQQSDIDKALDQARLDMPAKFSAVGIIKQFGWGLIIYAVLSAITALFVKKNQPEVF